LVLDTSALLALLFYEEHARWVKDQLVAHALLLRMSTVNLAETLILVESRQPALIHQIREEILSSSIQFIPPSLSHAKIAAQARLRYPLNLGDCFAYALAKEEKTPILTLDRDFLKTDLKVIRPL